MQERVGFLNLIANLFNDNLVKKISFKSKIFFDYIILA